MPRLKGCLFLNHLSLRKFVFISIDEVSRELWLGSGRQLFLFGSAAVGIIDLGFIHLKNELT